jgi:hypothetical protein
MIVEAGLRLADEFAEPQHHAELVGFDAEKSREGPQDDRRQRERRNSAATEIARQKTAQHALAAAEKFLKIGRLRSRTPRAAGLIAQRHMLLLAAGRMKRAWPPHLAPAYIGFIGVPAWLRGVIG